MEWLPGVLAAVNVAMAGVYTLVGRAIMRRRPQGESRRAATAFGWWWYTLAALVGASGINYLITHTVGWTLAALTSWNLIVLLDLVVALGALFYYLMYVQTGREGWFTVTMVGYAVFYVAIVAFVVLGQPNGIETTDAGSSLAYANDLTETTFGQLLGSLVILPPLLGALGYLSLYFRARERTQRFRIVAVGGAFVIWFGLALVAGELDWSDGPAWQIAAPFVALGATLAVYFAYRPTAWMQRAWRVQPFGR